MNRAKAARNEAMSRVEENAAPTFNEEALAWVGILLCANKEYTSDLFWGSDLGTAPETHEPRALGPVHAKAVRLGWMEGVGWMKSDRPECHARDIRVYKSLTYGVLHV